LIQINWLLLDSCNVHSYLSEHTHCRAIKWLF